MPAKITKARAEQLLARRFAEACERATPESICGEHTWQIKVLTTKAQNVMCLCSRRAGKSEAACGILLLTAIKNAGSQSLFLGLTQESAGVIWRKFKRLLRKLKMPAQLSEAEQLCVFPNGSRVLFSGSDDTRRITHYLGDSFAGGCVVIDEGQSADAILKPLIEDILAPAIDETTADQPVPGRLILLGTVPDVPAGYFWRTWSENYTGPDTTPGESENEFWACFSWSRFENPFEHDNEKHLANYIKKYKYDINDPEVQRRWFGRRIFDANANAYRFVAAKHTYVPGHVESASIGPFHFRGVTLQTGLAHYIVGIDQAQRQDRFAIIAWGWNPQVKDKLYHVAEAYTDPGADPQESEWLEVCKELRRRYGGSMEFIRDAGGSSAPVNDLLQHSHGITIVSAVKGPGSVKARVQRLSDLLAKGVAKVIEDSELANDLLTAKWSLAAREKGKWELDKSAKSPDLADAATYALDLPSFTQIGAPKPKQRPETEAEYFRRMRDETLRSLLSGKKQAAPKPNPSLLLWTPPPKA